MNALSVLEKLSELGVTVQADGNSIIVNPRGIVPPELGAEIRANKPAIIDILQGRSLKYPGQNTLQGEANEIARAVIDHGLCLVWSSVLQDTLAFVFREEYASVAPAGFVVYTIDELNELFSGHNAPSVATLKLIHAAKKLAGGVVKGHKPETGGNRDDRAYA